MFFRHVYLVNRMRFLPHQSSQDKNTLSQYQSNDIQARNPHFDHYTGRFLYKLFGAVDLGFKDIFSIE